MVEEIFKKNNIKLTKQRKEIYELLKEPQTIKDIINKKININPSTIYRIIEIFLKNNLIEEELSNNQIYYKIKNNEHINYIKCIKCHKKEKLDLCPIKKIKGFEIIDHKIELNGICEKCKKSKN